MCATSSFCGTGLFAGVVGTVCGAAVCALRHLVVALGCLQVSSGLFVGLLCVRYVGYKLVDSSQSELETAS